jgi:hypothetical protein
VASGLWFNLNMLTRNFKLKPMDDSALGGDPILITPSTTSGSSADTDDDVPFTPLTPVAISHDRARTGRTNIGCDLSMRWIFTTSETNRNVVWPSSIHEFNRPMYRGDPEVSPLTPTIRQPEHYTELYEHIDSSVLLHVQPIQRTTMCTCGVQCGRTCSNKLANVECDAATCALGPGCGNRWREDPIAPVRVISDFHLKHRVFSEERITAGHLVMEYAGEIMTTEACRERYSADSATPSFTVQTADGNIVDARQKGNLSRFMNHSCASNLSIVDRVIGGVAHVFLVANQNIRRGEELTFRYDNITFRCECARCYGFVPDDENEFDYHYDWYPSDSE